MKLPDSAKWAERLNGYQPWLGKWTWLPSWGPPPDSLHNYSAIPPLMLAEWKNTYRAEMEKARGRVNV